LEGKVLAKKIAFLLVFMFVMIFASVIVSAGTETTTPEAGFTEDKIHLVIDDLENAYKDLFFGSELSTDVSIVNEITYKRSASIVHDKRFRFYTSGLEWIADDPLVMLLYVKKDGEYVPLNDVETGSNLIEKPHYLSATVDLPYIGLNKVNELRIIIFRKSDAANLIRNKNVLVTDLEITLREWNLIEKVRILLGV